MRSCSVLLLCLSALAQVPTQVVNPCLAQGCFWSGVSGSIAASGTSKLTIQQPATSARQVLLIAAVAQCAGNTFTVDQAQNGTAATATLGTSTAMTPNTTYTARALIYTASNVGAGTATAPTLSFTAGDPRVIDLGMRTTGATGTANNYTLTVTNTGATSCTGGVALYWSEK